MTQSTAVIRPAEAGDAHEIAFIHVHSWQSTYGALLPPEFLASLSVEQREEMWQGFFESEHQDSFLYVAEMDGQVVAFCNFGPRREDLANYDCEMYAIYMLEAYQRKGIGGMLMRAAMAKLREEGYTAMYLWVMEGNPAMDFYEKIGGTRIADRPFSADDATAQEYAYGYRLE